MELGRVGFKDRDITDLLTMYGVDDDAERARHRRGGQHPRMVARLQ
jgi:hypothetical protein